MEFEENNVRERKMFMAIDLYTKVVLTVIAIAVVIIALNPWLTPTSAEATYHESYVADIASHVGRISRGTCSNSRIC